MGDEDYNLEQQERDNAYRTAVNYGLGGLLTGAGGAALIGALKNIWDEDEEKRRTQLQENSGPIIELEKLQQAKGASSDNEPTEEKTASDPGWQMPLTLGAASASPILGYYLTRKLWEDNRVDELKDERAEAEKEFQESLNQALKQRGLAMSGREETDENMKEASSEDENIQYLMDQLDQSLRSGGVKTAYLWDAVKGWGGLIGLGLGGLGGYLGWQQSADNNKARKTLDQMKTRRTLDAIRSPQSPIVHLNTPQQGPSRERLRQLLLRREDLRSKDEEEEEENDEQKAVAV